MGEFRLVSVLGTGLIKNFIRDCTKSHSSVKISSVSCKPSAMPFESVKLACASKTL